MSKMLKIKLINNHSYAGKQLVFFIYPQNVDRRPVRAICTYEALQYCLQTCLEPEEDALIHSVAYWKFGQSTSRWYFRLGHRQVTAPMYPYTGRKKRFKVVIKHPDAPIILRTLQFKRMPKKWIPEFEFFSGSDDKELDPANNTQNTRPLIL